MKNLYLFEKQKPKQLPSTKICIKCGKKESNPKIQYCIECSGKMYLKDGTNRCKRCNKAHDQQVIYKERSFMLCPDCIVPLYETQYQNVNWQSQGGHYAKHR